MMSMSGLSCGSPSSRGALSAATTSTPPLDETAPAAVDATPYKLAAEPAGAKGVIDVRKDAKDGDEVVVVGRVGGAAKPFTEGRATFLIVDPSLKPADGVRVPVGLLRDARRRS